MAARVNVRFVAILCTVVGVVFVGMAGAAYFIVKKSAADHFAAGQQFEQAGNFEEAQKSYSKAVNKERTNTQYLEQWIASIEKLTPETQTKYSDMYSKDYMPAVRGLAVAKRTDVEAWDKYLQALYERFAALSTNGRAAWQSMLSETNTAIEYFLATADSEDEQADWHRLRRYRALSNLNMALSAGEADPDFGDKTVLDFEAALRVDPTDDLAAISLYEWLMNEASQAKADRKDPQVYLTQAKDVLDQFLANNPDNPRAQIARLLYELRVDNMPIADLRTQEDRIRATIDLAKSYAPRVEETVDHVLTSSDADEFDVGLARLVYRMEGATNPGRGTSFPLTDRTIATVREAVKDDPAALAKLNFFEGRVASETNRYERAIEAYERVMESPQVPISLDGILLTEIRTQSVIDRAEAALDLLTRADDAQKDAALQRMTAYREDINAYLPQGSPVLMLLDARIAYVKGELAEAQRLAIAYQREAGGNDPQANFLLGAIYMDRNQPGEALRELERFVELRPNVPGAWAQLSALRERLGDKNGAMEAIEQAHQLSPDDENIARRRDMLRVLTNQGSSDDPVTQALIRVQQLVDTTGGVSPRYTEAEQLLRQVMARYGDDVRVYNALAMIQGLQGNNDEALKTIDDGLAKFPDSPLLAQLRTRVRLQQGEIPMEIQGVRRLMIQYRMALQQGRDAEAEAALQEAIQLAPDDPEVMQIQFARALDADNMDEARRLADRAAQMNSDQAGGRIFRSTLLQAEGRHAEALSLVDSVIADGLTSVPVLYRKAQILRSMGRADAAVEVYLDILRRQPDNVTNVREVVNALAQLGRLRQALDIARRSQRVAGTDPVFIDQWLKLEAEVGDATAAMLKREDIRSEQPENRENNLALVNVYIKLGEWAKARPIIDQLRADQDDVTLAMLDARWHAAQGELGRAVSTFEQYMAARQRAGQLDVRDVLSYANFLQSQDQTNRAIAMLRASLDLEPEESKPIHRRLALLLLTTGRAEEAVQVIDQLIAAGDDADGTLELARAEAYIRGGMLDKAQQALDGLNAKNKVSEAAGILRADLAMRQGNRRDALKALSDTLAANPTSARAYTRRAEIIWGEVQEEEGLSSAERTQLTRDATADLTEATKHDPNAWEAHRLLGIIAMESSRYDEAAQHIARAIEIQPAQSVLRTRLIRKLVQAGDTPRAMTIIDRALAAEPANIDLRVDFARLLADLGRSGESIRLFDSALAQRRNPEIAAQFVEFLLGQNTSEARAKARQVLSDPNLNVAGTWQLQLMAAALSLQEGNRPRAVSQARQSFLPVQQDTSGVVRWFNAMPALIKDHQVRMEVAVQLGVENTPQRVGEIMLASLMLQDPSTEQQGLSELRRLANDRDGTVAVRAGQLLGDTLYARKEYSGAVEAWRAVIGRDPEASQSLNNMAFVLATELGDCEQAIDLAKRAREAGGVAPAIVLSTLAVSYTNCDRLDEAQQVAEELYNISRGTPEESLACIRLGEIAFKRGKTEEARNWANQARTIINSWGDRAQPYESILQAFVDKLE